MRISAMGAHKLTYCQPASLHTCKLAIVKSNMVLALCV